MTQFSEQYHVCFPSSSQFPFYLKYDDEYWLSLDDVNLFLSNDSTMLNKENEQLFYSYCNKIPTLCHDNPPRRKFYLRVFLSIGTSFNCGINVNVQRR